MTATDLECCRNITTRYRFVWRWVYWEPPAIWNHLRKFLTNSMNCKYGRPLRTPVHADIRFTLGVPFCVAFGVKP